MRSTLALWFLGVIVGCGTTGRGFAYDDKAAVRTAFIDVVKECYRERRDGVLQAPRVDPDRVRFLFLYDKEAEGVESECVDLTFGWQTPASAASGVSGPVWRVLAYHPLRGPNRVMDEQTRRIEGMLQERLKPPA